MRRRTVISVVIAALGTSALVVSSHATAGPPAGATRADHVAAYWTPERVASAQPRDLVMDEHGVGYLRGADGSLTPRGRTDAIQLSSSTPMAKSPSKGPSGGGSDNTAPAIADPQPVDATITASDTDVIDFSAQVTDGSGIRSVSVVIHLPGGSTSSFPASSLGGDRWGTSLTGFVPGGYSWDIVAKDAAPGGGNTARSGPFPFTIVAPAGSGSGGTNTIVTKAQWPNGGAVQSAAGRILFEMPTEVRRGRNVTIEWNAYVCSGTVVTEQRSDASIILTAAHCVYDDASKQFARNVLFIPNQDDGGTDRTDWNCGNDPFGCWAPTYGVVDADYTTTTFPNNNAWDYGFYVVPTTGAHDPGYGDVGPSLEDAVGTLAVEFNAGQLGQVAHALGYSYADDPKFMYCAESLGQYSSVNWMLPSCALTGGSSGGPWVQPMDESAGRGPIISVNSWGYTTKPGMAGPKLGDEAACTFGTAVGGGGQAQQRGVVANCP